MLMEIANDIKTSSFFKIGDTVTIKGGSFPYTVFNVHQSNVTLTWFDKQTRKKNYITVPLSVIV